MATEMGFFLASTYHTGINPTIVVVAAAFFALSLLRANR